MSSIVSRIREMVSISVRLFVRERERETRNACLISLARFVATSYYVPRLYLINRVARHISNYTRQAYDCRSLVKITGIRILFFLSDVSARAREIVFLFSFRHLVVFFERSRKFAAGISFLFSTVRIYILFRKPFGIMHPILGD